MKERQENMSDDPQIVQSASLASGNTQIGVQHNHYGISAEEATRILMNLFLDNFPRLQQLAAETAKQRAEELCQETIDKLYKNGINDYSAFGDPDVQYAFWEAQKNYARFGKQEMLENISSLIASRVKYNSEDYIKIVLDQALSVVGLLSQEQLDYLSLLFLIKCVKFNSIRSIDELKDTLNRWNQSFKPGSVSSISLLNSLGCLEINIGNASKVLAKTYGFPEDQIKIICPDDIEKLDHDYGPTQIGMVLSIVNIENKTDERFNIETWVRL